MMVVVSKIHLVQKENKTDTIFQDSRWPLLILLIGQLTRMASSYHPSLICHVCWQYESDFSICYF